jgi:hypothetical protein
MVGFSKSINNLSDHNVNINLPGKKSIAQKVQFGGGKISKNRQPIIEIQKSKKKSKKRKRAH